MVKSKEKKDEFANLTSQLNKKQQEKKSTWKPEQEKTVKVPKAKKEEKEQTNLRLKSSIFKQLKYQAFCQDRGQNVITDDALEAYFVACEKWEGQGHETILSNLLEAIKNK